MPGENKDTKQKVGLEGLATLLGVPLHHNFAYAKFFNTLFGLKASPDFLKTPEKLSEDIRKAVAKIVKKPNSEPLMARALKDYYWFFKENKRTGQKFPGIVQKAQDPADRSATHVYDDPKSKFNPYEDGLNRILPPKESIFANMVGDGILQNIKPQIVKPVDQHSVLPEAPQVSAIASIAAPQPDAATTARAEPITSPLVAPSTLQQAFDAQVQPKIKNASEKYKVKSPKQPTTHVNRLAAQDEGPELPGQVLGS